MPGTGQLLGMVLAAERPELEQRKAALTQQAWGRAGRGAALVAAAQADRPTQGTLPGHTSLAKRAVISLWSGGPWLHILAPLLLR